MREKVRSVTEGGTSGTDAALEQVLVHGDTKVLWVSILKTRKQQR